MTESAKLLEIAKQEPATPPTTPEKSPSNIIKERLNLHVKRRLQQEAASPSLAEQQQHGTNNYNTNSVVVGSNSGDGHNKNNNNDSEQAQLNKRGDKQVKTRKPYQKRSDKTAANDASAATVRKYKRNKTKQVGSTPSKVDDGCSALSEQPALPTGSSVAVSGSHGGGDDGDGSHDGANDAEAKCSPASRDKDKSPDVLGMVLSAKKRALMQHPDVQAFLNQVMEAIKS